MSAPLTAEQIDEAILALVVAGPGGPEAGVTLARIAGRALKYLQMTVGHAEAVQTADTLSKLVKARAFN
jgi:hypothetical protein